MTTDTSTRIILTGGGTAGHVTPNIALIKPLQERGFDIHYIGLDNSIEQKLICEIPNVTFHPIRGGKLRRYFSWENFTDAFKVLGGIGDAKKVMKEVKPCVLFSKGGFVSVPAVKAAHRFRVPIILHESDYTPGLANKISSHYAKEILVSFEDTLQYTGKKGIFTGTPIRTELLYGNAEKGLSWLNFERQKPVLLIMGGSLGAKPINKVVRESLPTLLQQFNIVHICGKGDVDENYTQSGYRQYEYINAELPDVFAASDIALSRAGANSVFEFLAVALPVLFIPLTKETSRGDQLLNAAYFERMGYADVLFQENATSDNLIKHIQMLYQNCDQYKQKMQQAPNKIGNDAIIKHILQYT